MSGCVTLSVCAQWCYVGSDRSDGCSVVAFHLNSGHHLQYRINTYTLPDIENNTTKNMCGYMWQTWNTFTLMAQHCFTVTENHPVKANNLHIFWKSNGSISWILMLLYCLFQHCHCTITLCYSDQYAACTLWFNHCVWKVFLQLICKKYSSILMHTQKLCIHSRSVELQLDTWQYVISIKAAVQPVSITITITFWGC